MDDFFAALQYVFTPWALFWMMLGTSLGIVVGAIPGLTGAMLIALTLPLTFYMEPSAALILLVSMYVGSISGGLISATLLRMPGTPAAIMTTLDGYPLAQRGQAGRALGLGISASLVGGLISWLFLVLLARPMSELSLLLGKFEFFTLVLMSLVLIAAVAGRSVVRGVFAGLLGILASMPGAHPATGQTRLTMGFTVLDGGLDLLPVLIGLFAVSQVLRDVIAIDQPLKPLKLDRRNFFLRGRDWAAQAVNLVRSSLIGTWIGILPGIGANIGSVLAYGAARSMSRDPESFGHGSEEGIVASEAANNATIGGALIPLIALGVPGSVIDAILLGALEIHRLQPGPLLFRDNPQLVYIIMATVLLANVFMALFMTGSVGLLVRLIQVPRSLLIPVILVFCVLGSYAVGNRMFNVWVMFAFGGLGFLLDKWKIPLAPFVIGFVLAPLAERSLGAGLQLSGGSYLPLVTRPLSLTFLIISAVLLAWPFLRRLGKRDVEDT